MMNKISDIQIGKEYFVLLIKDIKRVRQAIVKDLINETKKFPSDRTEILIQLTTPKRKLNQDFPYNLLRMSEIGIGATKEEALANYGRFKYEENPAFSDHY